jgi:hypothetical protein
MTKEYRPVQPDGYRQPRLTDCGEVKMVTRNSDAGWPPEGEGPNIVWGNFAPEHRDVNEPEVEPVE